MKNPNHVLGAILCVAVLVAVIYHGTPQGQQSDETSVLDHSNGWKFFLEAVESFALGHREFHDDDVDALYWPEVQALPDAHLVDSAHKMAARAQIAADQGDKEKLEEARAQAVRIAQAIRDRQK